MEQFIFIDRETGESVFSPVDGDIESANGEIHHSINDAETGEPEIDVGERGARRRVPFQVRILSIIAPG